MLLNLIKHQRKDPFESKHQLLINGREKARIQNLKYPKAFIDSSQIFDDVYENLKDYNPTKKSRVLIVFDDMIADMKSNKNLSPIVTELVLRGRKLSISLALFPNLI